MSRKDLTMSQKRVGLALIILCLSSILLGASLKKGVVAKVGRETISEEALQERVDYYSQNPRVNPTRAQVLDEMVNELLIVSEAKSEKYNKRDDYKKAMDETSTRILLDLFLAEKIEDSVSVSDEEMRAYYDNNAAIFQGSRRASHILVETQEEAEAVLARIQAGEDFASLARELSQDPGSSKNGGDLGYFTRGRMVPEFEEAVFSLTRPKEVSNIVQTQFGYHIIQLEEPYMPYEVAREQIRPALLQQKRQQSLEALINDLKEKYSVDIKEVE